MPDEQALRLQQAGPGRLDFVAANRSELIEWIKLVAAIISAITAGVAAISSVHTNQKIERVQTCLAAFAVAGASGGGGGAGGGAASGAGAAAGGGGGGGGAGISSAILSACR
jgi:hypothetical protein